MMLRALLSCLVLAGGSGLGATALADPANPPQLAPSGLATSLDAVARLRGANGTRGGCSAVLIAPDRALTAAHCARRPVTGPTRMTLTFRPGAAEPLFSIPVRAVHLHAEAADLTTATAHADLALLLLEGTVPPGIVTPIPLADGATQASSVALFGYLNPDIDLLHGHETCALVPLSEGLLGSDCRVVSGLSGAPVLSGGPGAWAVEGIAVASVASPTFRALIADVVPWPEFVGE